MNGQVARKLLAYFSRRKNDQPDLDVYNLTKREKEILLLLIYFRQQNCPI